MMTGVRIYALVIHFRWALTVPPEGRNRAGTRFCDCPQVWLLLGLIREVTNVQLTPFFHKPGEPDRRGWSWERIGGLGHTLTRILNRWHGRACSCDPCTRPLYPTAR